MSQEDEGQTERFDIRVYASWMHRVDEWRRKQEDLPSRGEASKAYGVGVDGETEMIRLRYA
jgi:hypothetical protein